MREEDRSRKHNDSFRALDAWQARLASDVGHRNSVLPGEELARAETVESRRSAAQMVLGENLVRRAEKAQERASRLGDLMKLTDARTSSFLMGLAMSSASHPCSQPHTAAFSPARSEYYSNSGEKRIAARRGRRNFVEKNKQVSTYHPINQRRIRRAISQIERRRPTTSQLSQKRGESRMPPSQRTMDTRGSTRGDLMSHMTEVFNSEYEQTFDMRRRPGTVQASRFSSPAPYSRANVL